MTKLVKLQRNGKTSKELQLLVIQMPGSNKKYQETVSSELQNICEQ